MELNRRRFLRLSVAAIAGGAVPGSLAARARAAPTPPAAPTPVATCAPLDFFVRSVPAKLTTVAAFPPGFFLENLAVRSDNSLLVTVLNRTELWFVPSPERAIPVAPLKLATFATHPSGIVETEPDIFYISVGAFYNSDEAFLYRLDLRGWVPGTAVQSEQVLQFPKTVRALNGSCLFAPRVLLLADCFAGLIWRVDLPEGGGTPAASVWLQHESMGYFPGAFMPEQPGINGIGYAAKQGYVYYTNTAKKLFMRVPVHPQTLAAAGEPEHVSVGGMYDDFCIDEDAGVVYVTTHRQDTIDCISLGPPKNGARVIVAGDPFTYDLIGPSSGRWSRRPGDSGKVAYVTTDGGTASPPPDGVRRPAKVLRVELPAVPEALRS